MKLKKKKGYSLILMLIVTAFILTIGAAVLAMHTSTRKLEVGYDNKSRIYYMAASGLNAGEAMWGSGKNQGTTEFNMPDSTGNPVITCKVTLQKDTQATGKNTVVSTATCKGVSKSVSKVLGAAVTPSRKPSLIDGCINEYGGSFSIGNGNNTHTTANGSIYIQSVDNQTTTIASNLTVSDGNLTIINNNPSVSVLFANTSPVSTANVSGSAFIQSAGGVDIEDNLISNKGLTILSDKSVYLSNNGTQSSINGNVYINSNTGFKMAQPLTIDNGDLTVENNSNDINFDNDAGIVKINDGSVYLHSSSNIQLQKVFNVSSNLTAKTDGNIKVTTPCGTQSYIKGDWYLCSSENNVSDKGIDSEGGLKTGGACSFITGNSQLYIQRATGYDYNIGGDYYLKSDMDINNTQWVNDSFPKSFSEIAGGTVSDPDYAKESISGAVYRKDKNGIHNSTVSNPPFIPTVPPATKLPDDATKITNVYNIGTIKDGQSDAWDKTSYSNVACVKVKGSDSNEVVRALQEDCGKKYKLIVIDGDFTIDSAQATQLTNNGAKSSIDINNTIIYCTGAFRILNTSVYGTNEPVNLNHSVIYGKTVFTQQPEYITMTAINKPRSAGDTFPSFKNSDITDVNSILDKYLLNYSPVS